MSLTVDLPKAFDFVADHDESGICGQLSAVGKFLVDDVLPHLFHQHWVVMAGTVKNRKLTLPKIVGLSIILESGPKK